MLVVVPAISAGNIDRSLPRLPRNPPAPSVVPCVVTRYNRRPPPAGAGNHQRWVLMR
ncbi:hypothetical protein N5T50_14930 [Escherichia coli]|nr:hypothetical protein [Escherichia coli]MCW3390993.1 hypothetical protein [Escherichia coli]